MVTSQNYVPGRPPPYHIPAQNGSTMPMPGAPPHYQVNTVTYPPGPYNQQFTPYPGTYPQNNSGPQLSNPPVYSQAVQNAGQTGFNAKY